MRTAQSEFDLRRLHIPDAVLVKYAVEDTSWHNDVCPSFKVAGKWKLWVDYDLPELRESQGKKYTVMALDEYGGQQRRLRF